MKKIKTKKLAYKFLLFVIPFLIFSILVTSIILCSTSYNYFIKTIDQDYKNIIKSSEGEVRCFMEDAQEELEIMAKILSAAKLEKWKKEMAINAFNHVSGQFMSISLLSSDGSFAVSTMPEEKHICPGRNKALKKAFSGETAISNVSFNSDKIPFICIAAPIFYIGEVKEVLLGRLNLKSAWDLLKEIKIGRTGHMCIIDTSGRVIGHREIDRVLAIHPHIKPEILKKILESETPFKWFENTEKTKLYCLGYHIHGLEWIIILTQNYDDIYAYLYQNIYKAILLTALISLLVGALSWHLINSFLSPIKHMHAQVLQISRGDLDQKIKIESDDEIGDLGRAFNVMTDSVKKFIQREVGTARRLAHAENLAILGTSSSKVAHEVRNLLNNIGLIILTLNNEALSLRGKKALEILKKDSVQIGKFINSLLQFAKKPDLNLKTISMEKIIKEVLLVYRPEAEKRRIDFELNMPLNLPTVKADRSLMYQAINNIIKNSLEATPNHGKIIIEGNIIKNKQLQIRIKDTGSGIKEDLLAYIFDPFYTTKGRKGTGLGLAIVKTIVESHLGSIECYSKLNRGTTFIINLPI